MNAQSPVTYEYDETGYGARSEENRRGHRKRAPSGVDRRASHFSSLEMSRPLES